MDRWRGDTDGEWSLGTTLAGVPMVPLSWTEMQCPETKTVEKRKVAKVAVHAAPTCATVATFAKVMQLTQNPENKETRQYRFVFAPDAEILETSDLDETSVIKREETDQGLTSKQRRPNRRGGQGVTSKRRRPRRKGDLIRKLSHLRIDERRNSIGSRTCSAVL